MKPLSSRDRALAEGMALLYIAVIAAVSMRPGWSFLLFPELAALSHDVLVRPFGKWASQPWRLIATPMLTAVLGTAVTRFFPYHVLTILLIVCLSVLIIALLRSNIAPAISAGVLPLVLGTTSWLYPVLIVAGLGVLAAVSVWWRKRYYSRYGAAEAAAHSDIDDILESKPDGSRWFVPWLAFVAVAGAVAQVTGLRFILFPPLIVIAYEMFAHPAHCPWNRKPLSLPIACFVTAIGGVVAASLAGSDSFLAVGACLALGLVVLRALDVHMPPALAVGLIPFVMQSPDMRYPLSVGAGTTALTLSFTLYRRFAGTPKRELGLRFRFGR